MKCLSILVPIALTLCACSSASHRAAPSPQYAGVVTKAQDAKTSLSQAQIDSAEVRRLQLASKTILKQLDDKLVKLLEK